MKRFSSVFKNVQCPVIGMVHVRALPGTPQYGNNFEEIIQEAIKEMRIYKRAGIDAVLIENMHDIPYVQEKHLGPEIATSMTRVAVELRRESPAPELPLGIQILACGNQQALAVAKAAQLQFIRAEGFVFGHVADEGYTDACAGNLLRYRKQIDANDVLILTDMKKKHSSHAITADVSLQDTVHAAEFFLSDGVILTGQATGDPADQADLNLVAGHTKMPVLIGSGVTLENVGSYFPKSSGLIIGSYFKENGQWQAPLSEQRVTVFMERIRELRQAAVKQ